MRVEFEASEYGADQGFRVASFALEGSPRTGWRIARDGAPWLELGPGYRLLRTESCGVCSTDLARHHLPFPLPQVTGHELVARDEDGRRVVVEINASHAARGLDDACPFCATGLETHCPERLVLGIHDLPGGFGPWVLAPVGAVIPVPDDLPTSTAVLVEPFAAALHAATTIDLEGAERVAVLGPRRLGMLVVAALRAHRERTGGAWELVALARRPELLDLARRLGATETRLVEGDRTALEDGLADVVIDTTGDPEALALAVRLARREVHLKSTHGRPACGLRHTTELVVDELSVMRLPDGQDGGPPGWAGAAPRVAWLAAGEPPAWLARGAELVRAGSAAAALDAIERATPPGALPRADLAVVTDAAGVDAAIRPRPGQEVGLVRPRGRVALHAGGDAGGSPLLAAILERDLVLSSSRCGDFRAALVLLAADERLRGLGEAFVTHRFPAEELPAAFATATSRACLKAVVEHVG